VVEGGIGLPELNLSLFAASQSYSVGNRPTSVNKTVGQIFPLSLIEAHAVARCNINRNVLSSQGKSNAEIFGQTHVLQFSDLGFRKEVDLTIGNKNIITEGEVHHYTVSCLAHDATPQVPTAGAIVSPIFQVTGASLSITPGHKVQTACPVDLDFDGTIHTAGNVPTTVQYRFEWPTGERSTVFSVHVANPSAGAQVSHKVSMPLPAPAAPGPQGGGGATPGGFAQLQPPPPPPGPLPEAVPPQPAGPQLQGATLPANEHKSSVRLVVLSPGNAVSAPAPYHIVCEPRVRPGIAVPGGMTAPARDGVAQDPDRPVVTGTVPNPGPGPARSEGQDGEASDPQTREPEPVEPRRRGLRLHDDARDGSSRR
jgi:hypothetical protein